MHNHRSIFVMALVVFLTLAASTVFGQIIHGQQASGSMRMIYSSWSLEDDSSKVDISQFMVPVSGFVPLQDNLEMRFFAAPNASNRVEIRGENFRLTGMSDMRVQLNQSLSDDRILLSLGVNLPIGKKGLSRDEEQIVMSVLTENYLSFPIRRLGEGFGVNALVGGATMVNNIRYGASIMYQVNGSYEAYEDEGDYTPGNHLSITASADTRKDDISFLGEVNFSAFSVDKLDGGKIFKQSQHLDIHAGVGYHQESYIVTGDIRYLIRGRNTRYKERDEILEQRKIYGNEFSFAGRFNYSITAKSFIAPLVEVRLMEGNEYESEDEAKVGSSKTFGFGLEYNRRMGEMIDAGIGIKYYTGNADDGNIDLSGYRVSVNIQTAI